MRRTMASSSPEEAPRGVGFAFDRFGVRESIMGRVRRLGGTATVVSRPERGTEVHLRVPTRSGA